MRVKVEAEVRPAKNGMMALATLLPLAGGGPTEDAALASLRRSAEAWCEGLRTVDELEGALNRRGIEWTPEGRLVSVDVERISMFPEA